MDTNMILKLLLPVILIQLAIQIWAILDIVKRKKTKTLTMPIWVLIILLGEVLGSILYFLVGRGEEDGS